MPRSRGFTKPLKQLRSPRGGVQAPPSGLLSRLRLLTAYTTTRPREGAHMLNTRLNTHIHLRPERPHVSGCAPEPPAPPPLRFLSCCCLLRACLPCVRAALPVAVRCSCPCCRAVLSSSALTSTLPAAAAATVVRAAFCASETHQTRPSTHLNLVWSQCELVCPLTAHISHINTLSYFEKAGVKWPSYR